MSSRLRLAGLSAVVPALNEAAAIGGVVRGLVAVLPQVAGRWEVIVVDDGSADGTAAAALHAATGEPRVRVVRHDVNRGYGAALRTGFAVAREPWCFFTDGDGQFDPAELPSLLVAAAGADVVAGRRAPRADPAARRLFGRLFSWGVRRLFAIAVRDVNCAFKLVRCEVVRAARLRASGALVNAELLGKAGRLGFVIREVPVAHRARRHGAATGASPRVVLRAVCELLALAGEIRAPAVPVEPRHPARVAGTVLLLALACGHLHVLEARLSRGGRATGPARPATAAPPTPVPAPARSAAPSTAALAVVQAAG